MRVKVSDGGKAETFDFLTENLSWSKQSGDFIVAHPTGLSGKNSRVFVKKWPLKKPAPGHALLAKIITGIEPQLPSTPEIFDYKRDGKGNYYFSETLPSPRYRLLETIVSGGSDDEPTRNRLMDALVTRNLGARAAQAAAIVFAEINRRGFVYPDFTHKNIMVDYDTSECVLIDVDSCFPVLKLPKDAVGMQGYGQEFSIAYWYAFLTVQQFTAEALSRTMVLSFAAVWARAAMMLRSGHSPTDVQRLLLSPTPADQEPLWKALGAGDSKGFQGYFLFDSDAAEGLYTQWKRLYDQLKAGKTAPWVEVVDGVNAVFDAMCKASIKPLVHPSPAAKKKKISIAQRLDMIFRTVVLSPVSGVVYTLRRRDYLICLISQIMMLISSLVVLGLFKDDYRIGYKAYAIAQSICGLFFVWTWVSTSLARSVDWGAGEVTISLTVINSIVICLLSLTADMHDVYGIISDHVYYNYIYEFQLKYMYLYEISIWDFVIITLIHLTVPGGSSNIRRLSQYLNN